MTTIEKEGLETKAAAREVQGSFMGSVRRTAETPSAERYLMATDGHSSKSFVLVVQSQYIINAEFYESKLQPQ